jgi:hypothetical protein
MKTTFDTPRKHKFKIERFPDDSYTMTFKANLNTGLGKHLGLVGAGFVFLSFVWVLGVRSMLFTSLLILTFLLLFWTYRNINRRMKIHVSKNGVTCGVIKTFGFKDGLLQYLSKKNIAFKDVSRWDIGHQGNKSYIYALVHGEKWNVTGFISHELAEDLILRMEGNSLELDDMLDDDIAASMK